VILAGHEADFPGEVRERVHMGAAHWFRPSRAGGNPRLAVAGRIAILAATRPSKTVLMLPVPHEAKVILAGHEKDAPGEGASGSNGGKRFGDILTKR
jgi:hypothetical protein